MPTPYKYYITSRLGKTEVTPVAKPVISFKFNTQDFKRGYEQQIDGDFIFQGNDFKLLFKLETSIYRCEFLELSIDKWNNGAYVNDYGKGRIILNNADWDLDKQTVTCKIEKFDKYQCVDDGEDEEFNMFTLVTGNRQTVNILPGTLEYENCIEYSNQPPSNCPVGDAWTLYKTQIQRNVIDNNEQLTIVRNYYARYSVGNGLYKNALIYNPTVIDSEQSSEIEYKVVGLDSNGDIDNGIILKDLFQALLNQICSPQLTVVSNFFQWNPTQPSSNNYVTGLANQLTKLIIFQKSDVKRPSANNNATVGKITFGKLRDALCMMFNLQWDIVGNTFVLEHVSYFQANQGLNLTLPQYKKQVSFIKKYSYKTDDLAHTEEFKFMEAGSPDFYGLPITYNTACVSQDKTSGIKTYNTEVITTDVLFCIQNPFADNDKEFNGAVKDEGFVIVAVNNTNNVYSQSTNNDIEKPNNILGWFLLHNNFHRHNRLQKKGFLNNTLTTFVSVIKTKQQEDLKVPFCGGVLFNPTDLITTPLATNGVVLNAKYDLTSESIMLDVLFGADDNLVNNAAPVAVADNAVCNPNSSVTVDVLANDIDADGVIVPATLQLLGQPQNGVAVVTPQFEIMYTPNNGYSGNDYIHYRVKDDWGEWSNYGLLTVNVRQGPIAVDDNFTSFKNETLTVAAPGVLGNDVSANGISVSVTSHQATSANGGTVTVNSNGSFSYNPPNNFIGNDSFSYTTTDNNGLTDTAIVNLFVKERQVVYVRLIRSNIEFEFFDTPCETGNKGNRRRVADFHFAYFSDAAGTQPLDISGYNFTININKKVNNNLTNNETDTSLAFYTNTGVTEEYLVGAIILLDEQDCNGYVNYYTVNYQLEAGIGYIAL